MSEAGFIEGPWQLGGVVKLDGRTGDYQRVTDGDGMSANIIAHVCVSHPANFELAESGRANANLIAAAPDLLEALREADIALEAAPDTVTTRIARQKVRSALTKALGR